MEKTFDKIQHSFMIKLIKKIVPLNAIQATYEKPTTNSIFNVKKKTHQKLKAFPVNLE